jgi:hypothetical protein
MLGMGTRATLQKYMNKRRDTSKICTEDKRLLEREGIKELKTWHQQSNKYALVVQHKNVFIPVKTRILL